MKDAKFGVECKAAGLVLVPMVVEVFGRWGERSVEAMKLATKGCAHRASERVPAAGARLRRSLSVTLQRLNARILLARMDPAADSFADPVPSTSDRGLWPFVDEVAAALDVAMPPGEV